MYANSSKVVPYLELYISTVVILNYIIYHVLSSVDYSNRVSCRGRIVDGVQANIAVEIAVIFDVYRPHESSSKVSFVNVAILR